MTRNSICSTSWPGVWTATNGRNSAARRAWTCGKPWGQEYRPEATPPRHRSHGVFVRVARIGFPPAARPPTVFSMARQAYSDTQILQALRAAAALTGEPMSHRRYDAVAGRVTGPSSARIIQRFGTWRSACTAAGVTTGATSREYRPKWDSSTVAAAVAAYLAWEESTGTYTDYQAWARGHSDRPSGPTVRNIMGGWNEAKSAAGRDVTPR